MKIIEPSFQILDEINPIKLLSNIESYGRVCYQSESRIQNKSEFIRKRIKDGHESILEHEKITVKIICDRGVSHEIVRHRIASYSQESTRYCNYSNNKFGNELTFIEPIFSSRDNKEIEEDDIYSCWYGCMDTIETNYITLIKLGATPEDARSILPNSLKTEIVVTMNLREWRHFFKLRTSKNAHPQMRQIAIPMLEKFKELLPVIFEDIEVIK